MTVTIWVDLSGVKNSSAAFNSLNTTYTTNFGLCFKTGNTLTPSDTIKYVNLKLFSSVFGQPDGSLTVELRNTTNDTPLSAAAGSTTYASDVISFTLPSTQNTTFDVSLNETQIPNIANYKLQPNTAYALILYNANRNFALHRINNLTSDTVNSAYTVTNGFTMLNTIRNNTTHIPTQPNVYAALFITFGTKETTNLDTSLNLVASDSSITTTESSTITAHVTAGAIDVSSGTIDVSFNGGVLYSALPLDSSGQVSFDVSSNTTGTYPVQVSYSGTTGYNSSSNTLNIVVSEPVPSNSAPTDISLNNLTIAENAGANAVVGTLSTSDPDTNNTHTYTLVGGEGATGNASFDISGDLIIARESLDYETQSSYSVRIRSTDQGGLSTEKAFTINVTNVNEAPTDITLSNSSIAEKNSINDVIGTLSTTDTDAGDTFTYSLVGGTGSSDNASFDISGSSLIAKVVFDYDIKSSYSIRVRSTDSSGNTFENSFPITITDVNQIRLSSLSIVENNEIGTVVSRFLRDFIYSEFSHELIDTENYSDNASFTISENDLIASETFVRATKSSYTIRVRSTELNADPTAIFENVFTLNILPDNFDVLSLSAPERLLGHTLTLLNSGLVLITGGAGLNDTTQGLTACYLYNPSTRTFTSTASLNVERIGHTATLLDDGSVLVTGGRSFSHSGDPLISCEIYDPSSNTWTYTTSSMNLQRFTHSAILLNNGKVLIVGGVEPLYGDPNKCELYDPQTQTFSYTGDLLFFGTVPAVRRNVNLVLLNDGNILLTGGFSSSDFLTVYDAVNGTWSQLGEKNENFRRNHHTTILLKNGNILIYGGSKSPSGNIQYTAIIINNLGEIVSLIKLDNVQTKVRHSAVLLEDGNVLIMGGIMGGGLSSTSTQSLLFDSSSNTFALLKTNDPILSQGFFATKSILLNTNEILTLGGTSTSQEDIDNGADPSASAILYSPKQLTPSNSAPTDITLSNSSIAEKNSINDVIGTLSTTDTDAGDTFTYSLVAGEGDTDNASFNISGSDLRTSIVFDYETKTSYSIRVRSTDPSNNTFDKTFTINITDVNDGPGTVYQPFGITGGKISSQITALPTGSSFYFQDTYVPNLPPQQSKVYKNASGPLENVDLSGAQVSIVNLGTVGRNIVFSSIPAETHNALQIDSSFSIIFKVFDNSGNIIPVLNPTMVIDIYLDVSKNSVTLTANGVSAGTGTKTTDGHTATKFRYRCILTRGDGLLQITPQDSNASSGSDPHITTIFGKKYDFHPSTRKNYTLFKTKEINITSHFTGLKNGIFYDRVNIDLPNKEKLEVDFNKRKIKGKSTIIEMEENSNDIGVRYNNLTQNKSVGKVFKPKSLTKLSYKGNTPMDLYIDYQTRYVHFRFPDHLPIVDEMSGLIVEPATRLD
jgi:hypothetical protein